MLVNDDWNVHRGLENVEVSPELRGIETQIRDAMAKILPASCKCCHIDFYVNLNDKLKFVTMVILQRGPTPLEEALDALGVAE